MKRSLSTGFACLIFLAAVFAFQSEHQGAATAAPDDPYPEVQRVVAQMATDGFQGVVYFKVRDSAPMVYAHGAADCAGGRAIERNSRFDIGSITKAFTAAAVLKLVEQGKFSLDSKLSQFFPGVPDDKAGITVRQLLSHTSGFKDSLGLDETYINRSDFLKLAFSRPLQFAPGTKEEYSNVGFSVLAAIIEQQTGARYEGVLRDLVLRPGGTPEIGYFKGDAARNACGLLEGKRWGTVRDYFGRDEPSWHLLGNGALLATSEELAAWFDALWAGRILKPEGIAVFDAAILRKDKSGRRLRFFSGSNNIFSALYLNWPDEQATFIVMTNDSRFQKEKVTPVTFPAIVTTFERYRPRQ